jgi:hypothetical protein
LGYWCRSGKKDWWIPDDQYILLYPTGVDAPIPVDLQEIRDSILDGSYNTATKAKRVNKVITNQVSPQKMGKCSCLKGKCNPKH